MTDFDVYAADYEQALNRGLAASGESSEHFASGRISWLAHCLVEYNLRPRTVLDYGCGTGNATSLFLDTLGAERVVGVDLSAKSLEVARERHRDLPAQFCLADEYEPSGTVDLVFCNGVFHHIPRAERREVAKYIARCLRPGGLFAFWENNPWSPAARYVMSKIPFDRDAIMVWPSEARRLMQHAGLTPVRTDFCFIFPKFLRSLRCLEPHLTRLPLGAQYQVLLRK